MNDGLAGQVPCRRRSRSSEGLGLTAAPRLDGNRGTKKHKDYARIQNPLVLDAPCPPTKPNARRDKERKGKRRSVGGLVQQGQKPERKRKDHGNGEDDFREQEGPVKVVLRRVSCTNGCGCIRRFPLTDGGDDLAPGRKRREAAGSAPTGAGCVCFAAGVAAPVVGRSLHTRGFAQEWAM